MTRSLPAALHEDPGAAPYGSGPAPVGGAPLDLLAEVKAILRALMRHKLLLAAVIGVGLVVSVTLAASLSPQYWATASVMVGARSETVLGDREQDLNPFGNDILVESETRIIASRETVRQAVDSAGLLFLPALNPALGWTADGPATRPADQTARAVEAVLRDLTVAPAGRSRVIDITFKAAAPDQAAAVANAVARAYLDRQVARKIEENSLLLATLTERIADLRHQVRAKEGEAADFRADNGLSEDGGVRAVSDQIATVTAALTAARADLAELRARLTSEDGGTRSGDARGEAVPPLLDPESEASRALVRHMADARTALAEARARYRADHPIVAARARMVEALEQQIRDQNRTARATMRVLEDSAEARVAELDQTLARLTAEERRLTRAQVTLRALEREAESTRRILETFLDRLAEAQEKRGTEQADSILISPAAPPREASGPNRVMVVGAGTMLFVFGALLAVLLLEQVDLRLVSLTQAETWSGSPVLCTLPALDPEEAAGAAPHRHIVARPASPFTDGVRTLHLTLAPPDRAQRLGLILVTGPRAGEGKSTVAVSIARALAMQGGMATLLIDGDRFQPSVHRLTGVDNDMGLVDLIRDDAELAALVQKDTESTAGVLPMGREDGSAIRLQDSQLVQLAHRVLDQYDAVIVDSPGLLENADAVSWAAVSTGVLMVLSAGQSREKDVTTALRLLRGPGAPVLGSVVNRWTSDA